MASSIDSGTSVVCGVLCFIQNKMSYVPMDTLGEIVKRGFGEQEVEKVKALVFEAASGLAQLSHIRKKVRKNTGNKKKLDGDVEDILQLLFEADRLKVGFPKYATVDINNFPHIPLEEVDGGVLMEKVASSLENELEGSIKSLKESLDLEIDTASTDCSAVIQEMAESIKNEVSCVVKQLSDEFSSVICKLQEMRLSVESLHLLVQQTRTANDNDNDKKSKVSPKSNNPEEDPTTKPENFEVGLRKYTDVVKEGRPIDKWILVDNLRRRKIKPILGNRKDDESSLRGVETRKRDTWNIYVGNLVEGVSETQVLDYLKGRSIDVKKCHLLSSKVRGTCSARVSVSLEHKDKVLDPDSWPEHVRVRSWIIRPRWATKYAESQSQSVLSDIHDNGST